MLISVLTTKNFLHNQFSSQKYTLTLWVMGWLIIVSATLGWLFTQTLSLWQTHTPKYLPPVGLYVTLWHVGCCLVILKPERNQAPTSHGCPLNECWFHHQGNRSSTCFSCKDNASRQVIHSVQPGTRLRCLEMQKGNCVSQLHSHHLLLELVPEKTVFSAFQRAVCPLGASLIGLYLENVDTK